MASSRHRRSRKENKRRKRSSKERRRGEKEELKATWLDTNINCILMTLYALKAIKLISYTVSDTSE